LDRVQRKGFTNINICTDLLKLNQRRSNKRAAGSGEKCEARGN
jgi:hypothetical protein